MNQALRSCLLAIGLFSIGCGPTQHEPQGAAVVPESPSSRGGESTPGAEPTEARPGGRLVVSDDQCQSDADCVPAECCHASACVAAAHGPSCGDAVCTMECRYGTIDCGGGCICHEGRCAAKLSEAPRPAVQ